MEFVGMSFKTAIKKNEWGENKMEHIEMQIYYLK